MVKRKFNGKFFLWMDTFTSKTEAKIKAKSYKDSGKYFVRITKRLLDRRYATYDIWLRPIGRR